jgi:hypothetical protein
MSAPTYQISIAMSASTVQSLTQSSYILYAFKAVQDSDTAGVPVVWQNMTSYFANTTVTWTEQYQAWIGPPSALTQSTPITPGQTQGMTTGQTWQVTSSAGGTVSSTGAASAVSISNATNSQFTCGLSVYTTAYAPVCAFPLYGGNLQVITPLLQVLLLFSTMNVAAGTIVPSSFTAAPLKRAKPQMAALAAFTPGVLIDMTGAPNNERSVNYDVNGGWSWGGAAWGTPVSSGANLVPLLIQTS